jgi:hypothetical protein
MAAGVILHQMPKSISDMQGLHDGFHASLTSKINCFISIAFNKRMHDAKSSGENRLMPNCAAPATLLTNMLKAAIQALCDRQKFCDATWPKNATLTLLPESD